MVPTAGPRGFSSFVADVSLYRCLNDASVSRRAFVQLAADARARTASAIWANTPGQSPALDCRNSRVAGYQGLSSRLSSHRHSGTCMRATNVGCPSAPARAAIELHGVTMRSRFIITAAVSRNAPPPASKVSPSVSRHRGCTSLEKNSGERRARGRRSQTLELPIGEAKEAERVDVLRLEFQNLGIAGRRVGDGAAPVHIQAILQQSGCQRARHPAPRPINMRAIAAPTLRAFTLAREDRRHHP